MNRRHCEESSESEDDVAISINNKITSQCHSCGGRNPVENNLFKLKINSLDPGLRRDDKQNTQHISKKYDILYIDLDRIISLLEF